MKVLLLVVVLLGLVGVAGAYNYHRNAWMDQELESFRPYKGLSDEELDTLVEAHRGEMVTMQQSLGGGPSTDGFSRIRPHDTKRMLDVFNDSGVREQLITPVHYPDRHLEQANARAGTPKHYIQMGVVRLTFVSADCNMVLFC